MRARFFSFSLIAVAIGAVGCSQSSEQPAAPAQTAATATTKPALGIKPFGSTTPADFKPDYSKVDPAIAKAWEHIDANIDTHVENYRKWLQQPSISNSGEGIPESAEMVKGFFEELGCEAQVYDTGITEYGSPGNPVVFGKCNEGAPKTVAFWMQADTMPVTQPDNWIAPPFEARIVDGETAVVPGASRVVIARGASNSKGRHAAQMAAFRAMRATGGKFPVNLMFVVEMDEERMDIGLRKFFQDHSDLMQEADALFSGDDSEGCVYVELTTSGKSWGRGPTISDIHGLNMRTVDSVAWRHMHMLASLTSEDGNTPLIKGFFDNKVPPTAEEIAGMKRRAANTDLVAQAKNLGVARYKWDDPYMVIKGGSFETSFNIDGIWGGNMYAGGAGAIMPNRIVSKHNFRYVPNMDGLDIVKKLRAQIDANGYKDVEMKLIGNVPWSRGSKDPNNDMTLAHRDGRKDLEAAGLTGRAQAPATSSASLEKFGGRRNDMFVEGTGGYWPSYLWTDGEVGEKVGTVFLPMGGDVVGDGGGGRSHAANEYYTLEAQGKEGGFAYNAKSVVTALYHYAKINNTPPKPKK